MVRGNVLDLHRSEGAKTHVQRDIGQMHALLFNSFQQLLREVQAGRRRGG